MNGENEKHKVVPWSVFTSVIGIIIIALGWFFVSLAQTNEKGQQTNNDLNEVKIMTAKIQNDVSWIKEAIRQNQMPILKK